ncbi:MAG: hypothetical protein ABJP34_07510 [Erythrobacter sp.]
MRFLLSCLASLAALIAMPASAQTRATVDASAPSDLSVTVYRDPNRREGQKINKDWPQGFAMISETRTVTLPAGESTIRFEGVAEGMVAVSAIVSGLPGGTIEKNRNAELLSPAALVNGALGNRVTITRSNPGTGEAKAEEAIVRTRADGGLVLQTQGGFEAVRCAGLPEKLTFNGIPRGLSAKPVYSVNTRSDSGGTFEVVLTYISWGFDWQANYVGRLGEGSGDGEFSMNLLSWLTLVNNNGQSFDDAQLLVVAGKLNVQSNYRALAANPRAAPLRLNCYPIGSTAAGSQIINFRDESKLGYADAEGDAIVVTANRRSSQLMESAAPLAMAPPPPPVMKAGEENLGDLKLYRVPERVNVSAKGMKQVAFLNENGVKARYIYTSSCGFAVTRPEDREPAFSSTQMLLATKNDKDKGLGVALPQGGLAVFEPSSRGPSHGTQLVAEANLRDYASGQDVELPVGQSNQVFVKCVPAEGPVTDRNKHKWFSMSSEVTNANSHPVKLRFIMGAAADWEIRWPRQKSRIKDGQRIVEVSIPANGTSKFKWKIRNPKGG